MKRMWIVFFIQVMSLWKYCESINCEARPKNTETRLLQQLLCNYDKSVRPVGESKNKTTVKIKMFVKSFEFTEDAKLTINSWLSMRWTDENLKWNKKDFDNMGTVNLHSDDIWMPDLTLYNSKTTQFDQVCTSSHCIVYNTGAVSCIPPCSHEGSCKSDYTYWPFDSQNCSLYLGSWVHKGEEIDYQTAQTSIDKSKLLHKEWKIVTTFVKKNLGNYSCCPDETYPSLHYNFVIERHSASEQAFILTPTIILASLNLLSLWLSPSCSERILLCVVSLFSHFMFIQQLSWLVPKNGSNVPNAILFYRDSLVISGVLILLTIILRALLTCKSTVPSWVGSITESLKNNKFGSAVFSKPYIIGRTQLNNDIIGDDASNLIEGGTVAENAQQIEEAAKKENTPTTIWITVVRIIDILLFFVLSLVYLLMFIGWIPESYKNMGALNAEVTNEDY